MKITYRQLRQLINEELSIINEEERDMSMTEISVSGTGISLDLSKIKNTVIEGIDMTDHPDFSDAFVSSAEYEYAPSKFRDLTEDEINYLNENEDEWVWEQVWEQVN